MDSKNPKKTVYNSEIGALINKKSILELLYSHQEISRASIANMTGLTRPSITNIIRQFLECGLVIEMRKAESGSGRRQQLLGINPKAFNVVALEIERSYTKFSIFNSIGQKLHEIKNNTPVNVCEKSFKDFLFRGMNKLIVDSNVRKTDIFCCSIGIPGPVDTRKGIARVPNDLENFKEFNLNFPIKSMFENEYEIETFIDNDANCSSLSEKWFGIGNRFKNYIFLTSDLFGLGSGIVLEGEVYRGSLYSVGEIGHTIIEEGKHNFVKLEKKTGFKNLAYMLNENYGISTSKEDIINSKIRITEEKYPIIANELGTYVGIAIINLINLFGPELVVIGGKLLDFYHSIESKYNGQFSKCVYSSNKPTIMKATLGYDAGIFGVVALAYEKLISKPEKLIKKSLENKNHG